MSNNTTITAYDLLLYSIRNARSINVDQKRAYVERLQKSEWTPALRKELKQLCEAEAVLRAEDANLRRQLIADQEAFIASQEREIHDEQEIVMQDFDASTQQIKSDFIQNCNAIARDMDKQIRVAGKEMDESEIGELQAFLKEKSGKDA